MNIQIVMTRTELANYVGIHRKTLWKKIRRANIEIPPRQLIMPNDLKKILSVLEIDDRTWQQLLAQKKRK